MQATFTTQSDGILGALQAMLERGRSARPFLNRVIWRKYQKAQIMRWESENSSEGPRWAPLKPGSWYAKNKSKKYAAYPGSGSKLMIATGKLSESAMGRDSSGFTKLVTDTGIEISLNLGYIPYAQYASEKRPIMEFSDDTIESWRQSLVAYVKGDPAWAQDA